VFFVTRPAWRAMRERGYGRIVNTTSPAGILAIEGADHGIAVNAVAPIAATRMLERSIASVGELADEEAAAAAREVMQPFLTRVVPALTPEDVAANLAAIRDETDYTVPGGVGDAMAKLFTAIMPS
jgi:NAD(P)-dependent dehydrogenase (short-subunit alcohol dehydrogenase family)